MMSDQALILAIVCVWFILFGACIGSFLNVLVYRLPLRKSLVYPPSHCPRCGHLIRWYDNIPVFGWIKLRGKCRDCQLPISLRYPCVEGCCGMIFGGIFILLEQRCTLSLEWLSVLTLLASFLAAAFLAVCLMMYDHKK